MKLKAFMKWSGILLGLFAFLSVALVGVALWAHNGGDLREIVGTTETVKRASTLLQIGLLIFAWIEWPRIVQRFCKTDKGRLGMLQVRHWFCGVFIAVEILFYF